MKKQFCVFIYLIICLSQAESQKNKLEAFNYKISKNITCKNGAVVSASSIASNVGVSILKKGGNAIDAAIATQLALAVVYPGAGNLGGGGFMIAHLKGGKNIAIDFREKAPAAANRDMYLDTNGNPIENLSLDGHLASGVPGSVAGIFAAMKYAKLPFKKLIDPAIMLAENGFAITANEAQDLNENRKEFIRLNTIVPVFVKDSPWKAGDMLVQKDLASTLKRIRDNGAKGFYEGKNAENIINEMRRGNGIITYDDLKNYRAKEREAVIFNYKGYKIISMPLPSSGGIMLQQMLKMIEKRNVAAMKFQTAESVQLMTEIERRVFADRALFLGDADFIKVPVKTLLSNQYLSMRMQDYNPSKAGNSKDIGAGKINVESEETTHFDVIDADGNAVSITTTLNDSYGCKTVVAGSGFILNNEMDDFSVKPGVPNLYGAIGAKANAIEPGKRMLSSMAPTIVLKNNSPFLVIGTPGGTTIPTSVFQTIVNIIDFNLSTDDAVNKPKFHHQWLPDQIDIEKNFPANVQNQLMKMGYIIKQRGAIGRTEVIKVLPNKKIEAVADKRGDDSSAGW